MLKISRSNDPPDSHDLSHFSDLIHEALSVRRHTDFMLWVQGRLQKYVPHEILIAAWGDFQLGVVHYDVLSVQPDLHTENVESKSLSPMLASLFKRWIDNNRSPMVMNVGTPAGVWDLGDVEPRFRTAMQSVRSVLTHGIKDQRGRSDCLYAFFSHSPKRRRNEAHALKILLPYIDSALRQVELVAHPSPLKKAGVEVEEDGDACLGELDTEIMRWAVRGKNNLEIGSILNISAFTIKVHMQRIFKKLDVLNRAQAVAAFSSTLSMARQDE
jgi:transcriptional regulator EpsA